MDRQLTFADSEFSLSDPGMEDALYEITSMRQFAGLSLDKPIPDQSTILKFRHLLEQHGLARRIFADAGYRWEEKRKELKDVDADWYIAECPGKLKALKKHPRINKVEIHTEYVKASIRAKVEHPFRITFAAKRPYTINGGWHS